MLDELGEDRDAADDDAGGKFGPDPETQAGDVIADIGRARKFPSVQDARDRRYASTRYVSQSVIPHCDVVQMRSDDRS